MNRALLVLATATQMVGAHPPIDPPTPIILDGYSCENCFDEIYLDPFDIYDLPTNITFKLSFEAKPTKPASINFKIINSTYVEDVVSIPVTEKKQTLTYTYNNLYTNASGSNVFQFVLESEFGTDIRNMSGRKRVYKKISVTENGQTEESDETITRYQKSTGYTTRLSEKYRFSGYCDSIYVTPNQPFDICSFDFKYECAAIHPLRFGPVYCFILTGGHEYFDEVGEDYGGIYRMLRLTPSYDVSTKKVTLSMQDDLYVNPETQKMSTTPREGYIKTDEFYFPANSRENQMFFFQYTLSDFGSNGVKITATTKVIIMGKVMGNCGDSQYCIGTNETYPDIEIGEKITH